MLVNYLQAQKRLRKNAREEQLEQETEEPRAPKAKGKAKAKPKGKGKAKSKPASGASLKDYKEERPEDKEILEAARKLAEEEEEALQTVRHQDSGKKKKRKKATPKKRAEVAKKPRPRGDELRRELSFDGEAVKLVDDTHDGSQVAACLQLAPGLHFDWLHLFIRKPADCKDPIWARLEQEEQTSKKLKEDVEVRTPKVKGKKVKKEARGKDNDDDDEDEKPSEARCTV